MRYWIVIICMICVACGSSTNQDEQLLPTLVEIPTETKTSIPTEAFTPTITVASTNTSVPTVADTETSTPTLTATVTSSPTLTVTITYTSIPSATSTLIPSAIPTSERELIGQEVRLSTFLLEVFEPSLQYEVITEVDSFVCAQGYCNRSKQYSPGDIIEVSGLVCGALNSDRPPWYRVYEEHFFNDGYYYIPSTILGSEATLRYLSGEDPAQLYDCGLIPTPISPSTSTDTISDSAEEDVIVAWLLEQEDVDVVELISLDTPEDTNPSFYIEIILYPGFNDLSFAVALKDYVSDEFSIDNFSSFDVNISDGVLASNYYYVSGEWNTTILTLVTPPTPRPIEADLTQTSDQSVTCDCSSPDVFSCSNFINQVDAQACYEQCIQQNSTFNRLDRDGDGQVCESLP